MMFDAPIGSHAAGQGLPGSAPRLRRVLVTGGAGFIGSHTVDLLLREGLEVLVIDNLQTGRLENLSAHQREPRLHVEQFSICERDPLNRAVKQFQPEAIIHLAALVSVPESIRQPELNFEQNVLASHLLLEAARQHQVKRFVFASSAAVYGNNPDLPLTEASTTRPLSPYGAAKLATENLLCGAAYAYGIEAVANRYFNVYGPRQDPRSPYSGVISIFCERLAQGKTPTIYGDGEQTRDFVFVEDVARLNFLAATRPCAGLQTVNGCTGRSTRLLEVLAELREHFADAKEPRFEARRANDIMHSLGDPSRAASLLGFQAQTPLAEGLARYVAAAFEESPTRATLTQ